MSLLPAVLAGKVLQSVLSVCPSVCFRSSFWANWPLTKIFADTLVMTVARRGLKIKIQVQCYGYLVNKDGNAVGLTSILDRG